MKDLLGQQDAVDNINTARNSIFGFFFFFFNVYRTGEVTFGWFSTATEENPLSLSLFLKSCFCTCFTLAESLKRVPNPNGGQDVAAGCEEGE